MWTFGNFLNIMLCTHMVSEAKDPQGVGSIATLLRLPVTIRQRTRTMARNHMAREIAQEILLVVEVGQTMISSRLKAALSVPP